MKKRSKQFRIVVDPLSRLAGLFFKLLDILRHEVRHVHVLHHLPALFHWIQFRRISWQLLEDKPIRMNRLEMFSCRKMRRERIPNDHDLAAIILMDHRQKENHVLGVDRPLKNGETKIQLPFYRRHGDQTKPRLQFAGKMFPKQGRFADFRPTSNPSRRQGKARFINENQGDTELYEKTSASVQIFST